MAARLVRAVGASGRSFKGVQRKGPELFVKKISWVTGAKELTDHFSQFGKVSNITLPFDLRTGLHKGFAFIAFENDDFYEKIKKFGTKHIIDDEEVMCSLAGEEKSLLLSDANATPLGNKKGESAQTDSFDIDSRTIQVTVEKLVKQRMGMTKNMSIQESSQEHQKHTKGTNLTQRPVKTDFPEKQSGTLSKKKGSISRKPVVTRLTDSVKEGEKGDTGLSGKGYTVVQRSNDLKVDVMRNSFKSQNGFRMRNFKGPTAAFTMRPRKEDASKTGHVEEVEQMNPGNQQPEN